MVKIKPLKSKFEIYLKKRNLYSKFEKQKQLFEKDPHYPSLKTEILEPHDAKVYSFRIDKKYRAIFIYINGEVEIIDINPHYE